MASLHSASGFETVSDNDFDDEGLPTRGRGGGGLVILCAGVSCALLAGAGLGVGAVRFGYIQSSSGAATEGPSGPRGDTPPRVTDRIEGGVRFTPDGVDYKSTTCPAFDMDPDAATRDRIEIKQLQRAVALGLPTWRQERKQSWCSISRCHDPKRERKAPPNSVLHVQDVCLKGETLYLLSDRDAEPALITQDWWGPPTSKKHYKLLFKEVTSFDALGKALWLGEEWLAGVPKFRFGQRNIFHVILEEMGWLGRLTRCGKVSTGPETNHLLLQHRPLLGFHPAGRMWEVAARGGRSWFIPEDHKEEVFCFHHLHLEVSTHGEAQDAALAACEHVSRLAGESPPAWPGWPAGEATFRGFPDVVRTARARVGIEPELGKAERWDKPRVTVVHRLANRKLLNVAYVGLMLRDAGMDVTIVALECMPLEAQIAVVSNSSTLLGVHGAGMTFGHALPSDALVIELRSGPCTEEARGIPYQMRPRNQIVPSPRVAVMPNGTCPPPWKYNSRAFDVVVDIDAVLRVIRKKDPIASRPGSMTAQIVDALPPPTHRARRQLQSTLSAWKPHQRRGPPAGSDWPSRRSASADL